LVGEFVAAFVVLLTSVAFVPVPVDLATVGGRVEFTPEVGVFDALPRLCRRS
jgi:hypothetical protein